MHAERDAKFGELHLLLLVLYKTEGFSFSLVWTRKNEYLWGLAKHAVELLQLALQAAQDFVEVIQVASLLRLLLVVQVSHLHRQPTAYETTSLQHPCSIQACSTVALGGKAMPSSFTQAAACCLGLRLSAAQVSLRA